MPIATNPETGETVFLTPQGSWEKAQTAVNPQTKEMLAFDGQGWTAVPKQSKGVLGYIDDAVRSLASGVTFGFADELAAKADELTGRGGTYQENVTRERARDAQIPAAIAIPGEIAGAVGGAVATAPIAAATGAANLAARVPQVARFAGLGAAGGAAYGAGSAVEGKRLEGAARGGAVGAVTGAVTPYVVRGVSRVASGIRNAVSPQANVSADLARAITRDADTPNALLQRAQAAAVDRPGVATLADAGGENVRGLVERVAQTPGAGRTQVVPALTQRQQAQAGRLATDLRTLTGTRRSAVQAVNETMAGRADAARPLYQQAYQEGAEGINSPGLERLMSSDAVTKAMRNAVVRGRNRSVAEGFGEFNPRVRFHPESGDVQFMRGQDGRTIFPDLRFWDYTKRELDDMAGAAARNGMNDDAGVIRTLARQLRAELDEAVPTYRAARDAWSGPASYLDSIEQGRNILAKNVSAEEFANTFRTLSQAEQEAHRIGSVSAIVARMGGDSARLGDMTKYLRSPEVRAKIATIMPTPEAAAAWQRRLEFEIGSSELTGRALGNSATARRLAERADAENLAGDLVMDALTGAPQSLVRRVLGAGPRWLRDTMRSRADAVLGDTLTNPQRMQDLPRVLQGAAQAGRGVSGLTNAAATMGATEYAVSP